MIISLKQYVKNYVYKVKTRVYGLDNDFWEEIYLIDLEEI